MEQTVWLQVVKPRPTTHVETAWITALQEKAKPIVADLLTSDDPHSCLVKTQTDRRDMFTERVAANLGRRANAQQRRLVSRHRRCGAAAAGGNQVLLADGCCIGDADITNSVIGVRSIIGSQVVTHDSVLTEGL